jgi:hypothetical protein
MAWLFQLPVQKAFTMILIADIFRQGGRVFNQLVELFKNDIDVFAGMLVGKFKIVTG